MLRSRQRIPCWGRRQISLCFGGHHYSWSFLLAAVDFNILGVDFLQHFQLTMDMAAKQLRHRLDHTITAVSDGPSTPSSSTAHKAVPASGPARVAGVKVPSGLPATPQKAVGTTGVAHHLDLQEEALLNTFTDIRHSWGGASHCDQRQTSHHQISVVGQC